MGHQNVKPALLKNLEPKPCRPLLHLPFCVLVSASAVTHGTAQAKDPYAFVYIDFIFNADTPVWRGFVVFPIMVAMDI